MDSPPAKEFQLVTPLQLRASSAADYGAFPAKSPMARECSVGIQFVMDKKQRVRVHQVVLGTVGVKRRCCVVLRGVLHVCCSVLQCAARVLQCAAVCCSAVQCCHDKKQRVCVHDVTNSLRFVHATKRVETCMQSACAN